ncbi:MAG: hypothetical protein Q9170_001546 [Blastenia crenularia]
MTSINKLVPSIASGSFEIAPALANLNFDFALWKVAAPKEFEGVGSALSSFRREEAESGMLHTIARKLGALFERRVPATPGLTQAYGIRASEIAGVLSLDERDRKSYGVFASRAGADATSLWAAATSGTSAISVHLLACLLARIWDPPEAISIWVEIVKKRKDEVAADFDETDIAHLATLAAARQEFPRAQIAEWDASARAWLRVADKVKIKQQKQLTLILDNIQVPVNRRIDTYASVMEAWGNSLTQMEALVQGISQQARNGDVLLALYSWHLFPDIIVVKPSMAHVRQNDAVFVSGGVLTLGLETSGPQETGVHWSLPLAYLRHYGTPVVSECSMSSGLRSRLSLPELLQAVLGCLLQGWGSAGKDTLRTLTWLSCMYAMVVEASKLGSKKAALVTGGIALHSWLALLSNAASLYVASTGLERQHYNKLISLGRKHGHTFLGSPAQPLLGLINQGRFVNLIAKEEDKISFLRKVGEGVAKQMRIDSSQIFIRYKHPLSRSRFVYEYASVMPTAMPTRKRKAEHPEELTRVIHHRWLYAGGLALTREWSRANYLHRCSVGSHTDETDSGRAAYARTGDHSRRRDYVEEDKIAMAEDYERRSSTLHEKGESVSKREDQYIEDLQPGQTGILWTPAHQSINCFNFDQPVYKFIYGDVHNAALFVVESSERLIDVIQTSEANANEMYMLFECKKIDCMLLAYELEHSLRYARVDVDPHLKSLKAISTTANLFKHFPHASVDVRLLQRELYDVSWVRTCIGTQTVRGLLREQRGTPESLEPYALSKAQAFACITLFESGHFDVDPSQLGDVMAMSSGDVIYVSAALLTDPYEETLPGDIRGVVGNIGRPGISFLVPPKDPMIKEVSLAEWPLIERNEFDGHLADHFGSTSLHLSFTSAETPLNVGFSGGQDKEATILETLFSVYEGGRWIADLDVYKWADSVRLSKMPRCIIQHLETDVWRSRMICIDSWLGLVDAPEERVSLVRAHGNWQARLAASSLSLALGYDTVILPENKRISYSKPTAKFLAHDYPTPPAAMYTPFERVGTVAYSAVMPCILGMISCLNECIEAAEHITRQDKECSICNDTLINPGSGAKPKLAMTNLPCGHCFHEICILQWLSPIKLPATEVPTTGPTSQSDTTDPVESETSANNTENRLPEEQIHLVGTIAETIQNVLNRAEEGEQPGITDESMQVTEDYREEADDSARVIQRVQIMIDRLRSGDDEQIQTALRDIRVRGSQVLYEDLEDLEEGEIREGPQILVPGQPASNGIDTQDLGPIDLLDVSSRERQLLPRNSPLAPRGHHCPLCRQLPFGREVQCHADTLQLLRIRVHLTDLAYACFQFDRSYQENADRKDIRCFLERRHEDNLALGEREIQPSPHECRRIFKKARETLRSEAYYYMQTIVCLSAAERLRVMQLATFFENYELQDDRIDAFFNSMPDHNDNQRHLSFTAENIQALYQNPKKFFRELEIVPLAAGNYPDYPIVMDADEEMTDRD